ncbi:hypothetical protein C5B96_16595 [Subtercola sp. Z020]|uniref:hypothetical protein n=1 Tax=Subtercola sp. Z020 TaxID=2080582 RepID=UPI000CE77A71|nr:hypothetical protein [Subtercola sp. Z020]PPF76520.1 hypothetical protein C5B96_16595 [Subtercola sp. Z020]
MTTFRRSARAFRIGSGVTLAGISLAALAGCSPSTPAATPAPTVTVTVSPTAKPTATASASSSPTTTPTASGSGTATPVDISCGSLVFDSTIAAYSPTLQLEASFIPAPDNTFGTIGALDGALCSWRDSVSGSTIGVGVAKPSAADRATYEAKVAAAGTSSNQLVDSSTSRGYVLSQSEAVELDLFTDSGYWIAVTSVIFDSPSAAKSIFANILETLPSG